MNDKSHVSMEQKICPICGVQHEHDCGVLLDKRLKQSMERFTTTGYGLCEEHSKLHQDGFIALVVIDESKSEFENGNLKPDKAFRTGEVLHLKREVAKDIFSDFEHVEMEFIYIDSEAANKIKGMVQS